MGGRRQSYVNLDRHLVVGEHEIVEEGVSGDSGSTKHAKKMPHFFEVNSSNRRL